jgi:hypothetical protein
MFVEVYSFFSGTLQGSSTVIAADPSEVAYLRHQDIEKSARSRDTS